MELLDKTINSYLDVWLGPRGKICQNLNTKIKQVLKCRYSSIRDSFLLTFWHWQVTTFFSICKASKCVIL